MTQILRSKFYSALTCISLLFCHPCEEGEFSRSEKRSSPGGCRNPAFRMDSGSSPEWQNIMICNWVHSKTSSLLQYLYRLPCIATEYFWMIELWCPRRSQFIGSCMSRSEYISKCVDSSIEVWACSEVSVILPLLMIEDRTERRRCISDILRLCLELRIHEFSTRRDESLKCKLITRFWSDHTIVDHDEFSDLQWLQRLEISDDFIWIFQISILDRSLNIAYPLWLLRLLDDLVGCIIIIRRFEEKSFITRLESARLQCILECDIVIDPSCSRFFEVDARNILESMEGETCGECLELVSCSDFLFLK